MRKLRLKLVAYEGVGQKTIDRGKKVIQGIPEITSLIDFVESGEVDIIFFLTGGSSPASLVPAIFPPPTLLTGASS